MLACPGLGRDRTLARRPELAQSRSLYKSLMFPSVPEALLARLLVFHGTLTCAQKTVVESGLPCLDIYAWVPLGEAATLAIPAETEGTVGLAPCLLSRSITFLVNQSFGVCRLLARFRNAEYSNAAI